MVVDQGVAGSRRLALPRPLWNFGAVPDLVIALSWVPVFFVWHIIGSGWPTEATVRVQQGVVLALLISFLHQPLTFGLVYGDRHQFALHRRLFVWAPLVAVAIAFLAAERDWWIVVPIAAIWNLQHTVQQRYGVQRIYSGRSGYGSARIDRAMSYAPMAAVLFGVAAMSTLTSLVRRSGLDPRNAQGVELLRILRPLAVVLLALSLLVVAVVLCTVVRQELKAGSHANPAKWIYQGSSLILLGSIFIDPVAGFIAYVTAHAVEYAVIVDRTARRRYMPRPAVAPDDQQQSFLGAVARTSVGRVIFFGAIVLAALMIYRSIHSTALNTLVYTVGSLHFTYDSVIWKLRKPVVARDFAVAE